MAVAAIIAPVHQVVVGVRAAVAPPVQAVAALALGVVAVKGGVVEVGSEDLDKRIMKVAK